MYLHEEYIKRHNLEVPLVRYSEYVNLFLRTKDFKWQVLSGEWREDDRHPGKYFFRWLRPKHNSYTEREWFEDIADFDPIYWDQYEDFIYKWIRSSRFTRQSGFYAVEDEPEVSLTAWEIFLYTHDGWLARNVEDPAFSHLVMESTRRDKDCHERYGDYMLALEMIANEGIMDNFNCRISTYTWSYSNWLAKIINDTRKN